MVHVVCTSLPSCINVSFSVYGTSQLKHKAGLGLKRYDIEGQNVILYFDKVCSNYFYLSIRLTLPNLYCFSFHSSLFCYSFLFLFVLFCFPLLCIPPFRFLSFPSVPFLPVFSIFLSLLFPSFPFLSCPFSFLLFLFFCFRLPCFAFPFFLFSFFLSFFFLSFFFFFSFFFLSLPLFLPTFLSFPFQIKTVKTSVYWVKTKSMVEMGNLFKKKHFSQILLY